MRRDAYRHPARRFGRHEQQLRHLRIVLCKSSFGSGLLVSSVLATTWLRKAARRAGLNLGMAKGHRRQGLGTLFRRTCRYSRMRNVPLRPRTFSRRRRRRRLRPPSAVNDLPCSPSLPRSSFHLTCNHAPHVPLRPPAALRRPAAPRPCPVMPRPAFPLVSLPALPPAKPQPNPQSPTKYYRPIRIPRTSPATGFHPVPHIYFSLAVVPRCDTQELAPLWLRAAMRASASHPARHRQLMDGDLCTTSCLCLFRLRPATLTLTIPLTPFNSPNRNKAKRKGTNTNRGLKKTHDDDAQKQQQRHPRFSFVRHRHRPGRVPRGRRRRGGGGRRRTPHVQSVTHRVAVATKCAMPSTSRSKLW